MALVFMAGSSSSIQVINQYPPGHVDSDNAANRTDQEGSHQPQADVIPGPPADIPANGHPDEHQQPIHGLAPWAVLPHAASLDDAWGYFTRRSTLWSLISKYLTFEPTEEGEDDVGQDRTHHSQPQTPCTRGDANGCSEPDRSSRRYSHNLMLLAHFEDDAAADEADPGKSSLDYPAQTVAGHSG